MAIPPAGIALELQGFNSQFACITVGLAAPAAAEPGELQQDKAPLLPAPLPPRFVALSRAVAAVRALSDAATPLAVYALGQEQVRVIAPKASVAGVFKLLRERQTSCGIMVRDVKSCVSLAPLPPPEFQRACSCGLLASLLPRGWHQLDEDRLLAANVLQPSTDGSSQLCASLTMRVHAEPGRLYLLLKPEQVEFRHPAVRPGASLEQLNASLAGSECSLLPDLRPALIQHVRPADAATLAALRPLWASHGMPLPTELASLLEVSLDCDPDAPTFPYPPCRVLGPAGLHSVASRLAAPGVQAVLARLRDDLAATPIQFLGSGMKVAALAREWFANGAPPPQRRRPNREEAAASTPAFVTARQLAEASKGRGAAAQQLTLGAAVPLATFEAAALGAAQPRRQKRPHFVAGPKLQAALEQAKLEKAEPERAGTAAARHTPGMGTAGTQPSKPPAAPCKAAFAVQVAAAVAAGGGAQRRALPIFKRAGVAPAKPAPAKAAAALPKKRPAANRPPAAAKRAKPLPGSAAAASGSYPVSPAAPGLPVLPPSSAVAAVGAISQPASAAKSTAVAAGQGKAAAGAARGSAGPEAPPKAPAKPRAKAADIDVAAVTAKVRQLHDAGTLGKLTILELKAYLKSVGAPVGGKKGELEERARQRLERASAAAAGMAEA